MKEKGLVNFFENYLSKKPIFKDKKVLQSNYTPDQIFHRDEQLQQVANVLAPALRGDKPSNLFIYGKTGTGKTLTARYTAAQLLSIAKTRDLPVKVIYLNCKLKKLADTEYRLIAQLLREYGQSVPATGLPTDEVYNLFFTVIEKRKHNLLLILDEVDQLVGKAGDELLYNLTRINSELQNCQITLVGISNDLMFTDSLDPRVKSSLSEEELLFPPYNATQIQQILEQRSRQAFNADTVDEGVLGKCAAYAAREHGDARRALELLRVAGELAEREDGEKINLDHLDRAEDKIERDRILDVVSTQPKQVQVVLFSILDACRNHQGVFTGEIYSLYDRYCKQTGLRPLTQRRVSDVIAELDMLGIIQAKVVSKGRYGRTREVTLGVNDSITQKIRTLLADDLAIWSS